MHGHPAPLSKQRTAVSLDQCLVGSTSWHPCGGRRGTKQESPGVYHHVRSSSWLTNPKALCRDLRLIEQCTIGHKLGGQCSIVSIETMLSLDSPKVGLVVVSQLSKNLQSGGWLESMQSATAGFPAWSMVSTSWSRASEIWLLNNCWLLREIQLIVFKTFRSCSEACRA